jgi:YVTN family beta-propeller protein
MRNQKLVIALLTAALATGVASGATAGSTVNTIPGMPAVTDPNDIYAADRPGNLSPAVAGDVTLVYVPNTVSNTVSVINPKTYKVIRTEKVGEEPQHVVPSWDLKTLYVNSDKGNTLTPINPKNGSFGKPISVEDPYNLYFTPDGKRAVVMAERKWQIVFRDPHTLAVKKKVKVHCFGLNHADWTADGRYFVASCEFSGNMLLVDTLKEKVVKEARLPKTHLMMHTKNPVPMPQDVKISPDGKTFFIADMQSDGIWVMSADPKRFGKFSFIKTGMQAHGLYVTRDSKTLLITNRGEGSVSVLRFKDRKVIAKWMIPGGGSPDMGGISADGKEFWVSGRYDNVVYVFDIAKGKLTHKIKVGLGPHGLAFFPQPGRYSLGHTGIFR